MAKHASALPAEELNSNAPKPKRRLLLGLGALGIVFGDIGTSPLYAFQDIFAGDHPIPTVDSRVIGAVSMVFWTLTLVVTVKYVLFVMRADNEGEGGIMALSTLASRDTLKSKKGVAFLLTLGIAGAALFYGDGMITPAISVLSAVEGIEVAEPGMASAVLPIALVILIGLFLVQRHGVGKIGKAFGPIMLLWFFVIGILGLSSLVQTPRVLSAINPVNALDFFAGEPKTAFLALGSVVLCVTGAEALYADMGQFGRGPIRMAWFVITVPALYLNYFGQAALVLRDPTAAANPFYLLVPSALQIPMVILATIATVIASQAVISGAFSMSGQAIRLGYLPRLQILHTSSEERGQIYIPAINWVLMIAVIVLVLAFQTSAGLSAAYGIAVTGTFVITTVLITVVALKKWRLSPWIVWPAATFFFVIDSAFFLANMTKFDSGGWFPLAVAAVIFMLLTTWQRGRDLVGHKMGKGALSVKAFVAKLGSRRGLVIMPGTLVYLAADEERTPAALAQHVDTLKLIPEKTVILHFGTADRPRVPDDERLEITKLAPDITHVIANFGFQERVDVGQALDLARDRGVDVDPSTCTYVLHSVAVDPEGEAPMWKPRKELYAVMQRIAVDPTLYLKLPTERVIEIGTTVKL